MPSALTCAALAASWPYSPEMGAPKLDDDACAYLGAEAAGRLATVSPNPGIAQQVSLERARLELGGATADGAGFRLALEGRRSAPETGYIGLEGESLYGRVLVAEGRWSIREIGLTAAGGLVDDPWVLSANQAWNFRPFAPSAVVNTGLAPRSDLGGTVLWVAPERVVDLTVSLQSGEGLARRERNAGKDLHILARVRPILAHPEALTVALYGRQGSTGTASGRNHRFGVRVSTRWQGIVGGTELTKAWGVDGDTERTPLVSSTWAGWDRGWGIGFVRLDFADLDGDTAEDGQTDLWVAAGGRAPTPSRQAPAYLVAGVRYTALGPQASSVAGGDGTAKVTTLFVQVGANLRLTTPVQLAEAP